MAPGRQGDDAPLDAAHFSVLVDGVEAGFSYVGSLVSESDVGDPQAVRPGTVVLRRAVTGSKDLFRWRERVARGERDLRRVVIRQHRPAGGPVHAWALEGAWPCRWSGPTFDAIQGGMAFEEVELAYDRLVWLEGPEEEEGHGGSA